MSSIGPQAAVLWLLAQVPPEPGTQGPPAEWGGTKAYVAVEVAEERLTDVTRFAYTVRYVSTSRDGPPIVMLDIGARSFAGGAELTAPPLAIESPPGWDATVVPDDRSRPRAWRIAWSCAGKGWEHGLAHHIKAGQVRSGFRVTVPRDERGYAAPSYFLTVDPVYGSGAPYGLTGKAWPKRSP